jgi:methyltransferase-like protein
MKKPLRVDRLAYKTIGVETIILDTKVGKEVHQLNEVASFIWNLCDGLHTNDDIVEKVCQEFEVSHLEAEADVQILISGLGSKSLLIENFK